MISDFKREVARRVFAFEFNESTHQLESKDKAIHILLPTGISCNRVFLVGVLLDVEETRPDSDFWRVRISDPTGTFRGFVGRFQPDALEGLHSITPPEIVAVVAKVRLFEGDLATYVSLRPEIIVPVEREVRNYWVVETAKQTLERIEKMRSGEGELVELAWQIYNPDLDEYERRVKEAVKLILEQRASIKAIESKAKAEAKSAKDKEEKEEEVGGAREARKRKGRKEKEKEVEAEVPAEADEDLEELGDFEFEFEEEEWDLSDILKNGK